MHQVSYLPHSSGFRLSCSHVDMNFHVSPPHPQYYMTSQIVVCVCSTSQHSLIVLTIRGSYDQGFLQSGDLTIRGLTTRGSYDQGSYNQGFLLSGVQINVSYMTSLCPDVDIDLKILRSGVCVDREFSHPVRILCSDVETDLTRSYLY